MPRRKLPPRPRPAGSGGHDGRWWSAPDEKSRAAQLWDTVQILDKHHASRHYKDAMYIGMYENEPPYWAGAVASSSTVATTAASVEYRGQRVTLNIVKSVVDTAAAMLSKNLAEIKVLTSGGNWKQQKRAKGLTKFIAGVFTICDYHQLRQRAFVDGCLTKARGAVRFWADYKAGKIRAARVHPSTILWNPEEGDNPANIYWHDRVPRSELLRAYGDKHREEIEKAPAALSPLNPAYRRESGLSTYADMVDVSEGWNRALDAETPGRHVVAIPGVSLVDEEWIHEWHPFATFSWNDADTGWGGKPLADVLGGYQMEVGHKLRVYRKALERAASMAGAWVEDGADISKDELLDGKMWAPHTYRGAPPIFTAPPALGADFFAFLNWIYDKAFSEAGFSLMQSQGEKPAGIESGAALREYNDITATRQVVPGQRLERMDVQAGKIIVGLAKSLYANNPKLRIMAPGTKLLEEIRWSEVDMDEDAYVMKSYAVSALPTHAVGRIQTLKEMIESGILPQSEVDNGLAMKLLNFPDLEKVVTLKTANQELAQMQIDAALFEGEYIGPERFQDLALLKTLATQQLVYAYTLSDVPGRNLRYLERLATQAHSMIKSAEGPPALPAAPADAPPEVAAPIPPPIEAGAGLPVPAVPSTLPARVEGSLLGA